jgi:1L-myo-inositol 1-phosphate cytidylyltransferase / CDP-L-myo-inositol myo-inositolphosphotransferase
MVVVAVIVESRGGDLSPFTQFGGLSLITRAVLTAQKAGARTCYLYFSHEQEEIRHELQKDPRITSQLIWLSALQPPVTQTADHGECLIFAIDTVFRHPTIREISRSCPEQSVLVSEPASTPTLALIPTSLLPLVLDELQQGKPWDEATPLHQVMRISPPSGHKVFLRRLTPMAPLATVEQELLLSLENPRDGQVDTYFNRKLSRPITRWLVRTPLTPNQVTILSCAVGILGALSFFPGGYWGPVLGALLLQFSVVLDCCDGEIARVKFMESPLGDWLDIVCDTIVSIAIFLGIGVAVWHDGTAQHALLLAIVLAIGGALSFPFVTLAEKTETLGERRNGWEDHTIKKLLASLTTRDFSLVVVASAIVGKLNWFLWGAALGAHVFWLFLAWLLFRAGRFVELANVWGRKGI